VLAIGASAAAAVGLLALTGPAEAGAAGSPARLLAAPVGGPIGSAVLTTTLSGLARPASLAPRAVRRSTVVNGWKPGTVVVRTSALRRAFTFRVIASGPSGRRVLVQRMTRSAWRTLAVARTGSGAGHAFRVTLVVPRGTTAWRLLLPRTATASGIGTGTKRFVIGTATSSSTTTPSAGKTISINVPQRQGPVTGPGQGPAYATHYSFLSGGAIAYRAARWDRCRPIRVTGDFARVTSASLTPAGERARWIGVLTKVAAASGYSFVWLDSAAGRGTLDDQGNITGVRSSTGAYAPGRAHADIVVTYASAHDTGRYYGEDLRGSTVGYGGPVWRELSSPTRRQAVAGQVIIDYEDVKGLGLASRNLLTDLYLHEFGHVMGLGHYADPTQVMNPGLAQSPDGPLLDYRRGDREGLLALARQACTTP
jgi:hypothetical protein